MEIMNGTGWSQRLNAKPSGLVGVLAIISRELQGFQLLLYKVVVEKFCFARMLRTAMALAI